MSNAITTKSASVTQLAESQFTPEQMQLITSTIAKGATPDELKLFLYRCKNMNLDPLKPGQIYFIKYGNSPGTIVVGIEGFRTKAARTGKLSGIKRGVVRDDKGQCVGAWAEAYRSDWQQCAREEVSLSEYNTGKGNWAKMPETMIKKVAEAAVLRMAFPDDLGGIYVSEEMDQADKGTGSLGVYAEQPLATDGVVVDRGYVIDFGKWNRKTLEQVYRDEGPNALADYVNYLEGAATKANKPLSEMGQKFIREVESFLGAMENAPQ